jgi:hypothetical protein
MDNLNIIYPYDKYHKNYWAGEYSIMSINGDIEKYVISILKKFSKKISFIISVKDSLTDANSYYDDMKKLKPDTIQIVGALCSRNVDFPNILYLPLDDTLFKNGLLKVLSKFTNPSWENKISKVFWRGGTSGGYPSPRTKVTEFLLNNPNADVKLTSCDWNKGLPIPKNHFGDRCNLEKHFKYKYILIIDGNCIASNHEWVFGSGSVPIMITHPENNWWFKEYLKPMENYVPVNYDLSNLTEIIEWLVINDNEAKRIMTNAMNLANSLFSHDGYCHYLKNKITKIVHQQMNINEIYNELCYIPSDINEHLPILKDYASECNTIIECGVRDVVSSYSFALGLKGKIDNKFIMIDVFKSEFVDPFLTLCEKEQINASFITGSDLECELFETDLLFIDTWHIYGQLKRELHRWNSYIKKYIILHDTTTYEWKGEGHWCAEESSELRNMPVDEIIKGIWYAVDEFLETNKEWIIDKRYINNNGLTILKRL